MEALACCITDTMQQFSSIFCAVPASASAWAGIFCHQVANSKHDSYGGCSTKVTSHLNDMDCLENRCS